jgi:signal transduction histidine kinase
LTGSLCVADETTSTVYPEYPPRVRVEWLIASSRVVLAAGALVAAAIGPFAPSDSWFLRYSLAWYLVYSLFVLALVWTPVRFSRSWGVALHVFDLAAFSLFALFTEAATSPFYVYFTFLVICGTLRWGVRGSISTAAAASAAYAATTVYASHSVFASRYVVSTFVIRSVHLVVVAALLGYLGAHHHKFQREIGRIVGWPRRVPREPRELVGELIAECSEVLETPQVLIVWEEPEEGTTNLAWGAGSQVTWATEPEATYGSFVIPALEHRTFHAHDVSADRCNVVYWSSESFRQRTGRPINPALQARFTMRSVQSWSLEGEVIRGRLFALGKAHLRLDDLIFGEVVARLAVSRLDSLYLLRRLHHAAALQARLRVARDLHDSLLQSAAGAALQLLMARRLLDRDPDAAKQRLEEVQNQLEVGELEMRSFIRRLRPSTATTAEPRVAGLSDRLEDLRKRVERQWNVNVKLRAPATADTWSESLVDDVYRIVQEAVLNSARHADPSVISVELAVDGDDLRLTIADDGRGFPFHGSYDLFALNAMNQGPLTLRERISEMRGEMRIQSSDTGSELRIALPLTVVGS